MAIENDKDYTLKGEQVKDLASRIKEASSGVAGLEETVASKQDALTDTQLTAVNSGVTSEDVTKIGQLSSQVEDNTDRIVDLEADADRIDGLETDVDVIEGKIPAQASASNQLADKDFVNSSIATNTANFVGTFDTLEELEAVQNPTNNDYGFVVGTDQSGGTVYNRYKYNGSAWVFEYELNNSSFTAEQWAAIQSGITATAVEKLSGIEAGAETNTIDSISVNGVAQTPDENKNVNLEIDTGGTFANPYLLTTSDYATYGDGARVQMWKLPKGVYKTDGAIDLNVAWTTSENGTLRYNRHTILITDTTEYSGCNLIVDFYGFLQDIVVRGVNRTTGAPIAGGHYSLRPLQETGSSSESTMSQKAITDALDTKQDALTFDTTPTQGSTNPVTSGGVFDALAGAGGGPTITMTDTDPGEGAPLEENHFIAVYDGGE